MILHGSIFDTVIYAIISSISVLSTLKSDVVHDPNKCFLLYTVTASHFIVCDYFTQIHDSL